MQFKSKKLALDGPRVKLRTMELSDATEEYSSWLSDPEVNRYLATKNTTITELLEYIKGKGESDIALAFMIILKEKNKPIGTIKLEPIDVKNKKATIALMLGDRNSWGKGLMAEAMKILMDYGFNELGLAVIDLGVAADNERAIKLYEKLGFKEYKRDIMDWKHTEPNCDHVWMEVMRPSA